MNLTLFRHLWGVNAPWESSFAQAAAEGFGGIESGMPDANDRPRFSDLLTRHGLKYIAQIFTRGKTVQEHVDSFRQQVETARTLRPQIINCHSGRDAFDKASSEQFVQAALEIETQSGIPIAHETHRGRIFFNPWITFDILQQFPDLKITADYSHWVCVCERLLDDDMHPILQLCAERTIHLHARVGYAEGPQVPDPRAPEYAKEVEAHERWWDVIWDTQESRGDAESTLTPEFGPPGYLHTLPYTNVPVSNLEAICRWQAHRQAERFNARKS